MKNTANKHLLVPFTKTVVTLMFTVMLFSGGLVSSAQGQCNYAPFIPAYDFGYAGEVITDIGDQTSDRGVDIVVQPDGKVLVAAQHQSNGWDFTVVRYNVNGSLDSTFGTSGVAKVDFSNRVDFASGLTLQSDGKIVVVGSTCLSNNSPTCNFAVTRLNPNGTRDLSFGGVWGASGKVMTDFTGTLDDPSKVALQADGKIVVAGKTLAAIGDFHYAVVRYNVDGSLDTTFSGDGKASFSMGNGGARDLAIQPDGKIVLAGSGNSNFRAIRLDPDGTADPSFGIRGKISISLGEVDFASGVAVMPNGKIVLGGSAQPSAGGYAESALVRLNPNGTLDSTFDGDGKILIAINGVSHRITDLTAESNGEVTAVATIDQPHTSAVITYLPDSLNPCYYITSSHLDDHKYIDAIYLRGTKIYTAGMITTLSDPWDILVAVYETDIPM